MNKQFLRDAIDLRARVERDTTLKKMANTKGGEYAGACPFCGGDDRFRFWPDHPSGYAHFWCRGCERNGDAIQYVIERDGLTFAQVGKEYGNGNTAHGQHYKRPAPKFKPASGPPVKDWQETAQRIVTSGEDLLWSDQGARARAYLRNERGLTDETIKAWRLGYFYPGPRKTGDRIDGLWLERGILIPWFDGQDRLWKVNVKRPPVGEPKYKALSGSLSRNALFGVDRLQGRPDCIIVEGEFDAILLKQQLGDLADVLTLGSATARLGDRWLAALLPIKRFWIATDNDSEGEAAAAHWLTVVGERGKRVYPPMGEKDIGDAHRAGADLRIWAHKVAQLEEAVIEPEPAPESEQEVEPEQAAKDLESLGIFNLDDLSEYLNAKGLEVVSLSWPAGEDVPAAEVA